MKKEKRAQAVQIKANYLKPEVEVFRLGDSLNFLDKGFSSEGYIGDLDDGGELGQGYESGNGLGELGDGGEFGN